MYAVGNTYKTNMEQGKYDPTRNITGSIKLINGSTLPVNADVLKTNTLNINNSCSSNSLEIGTAHIGQCSFEYKTDVYMYDLYDAEITLVYHAWGEDIPLGTYYISEATRQTANWLKITGYDGMQKFDKNLGNFTTNGNAFAVLTYACTMCGVLLQNSAENLENFANHDTILNISSNEYQTWKDVIKDVAQILGGFATMNRYGKLEIRKYQSQPVEVLSNHEKISSNVSEYETWISEIDATIDSVYYRAVASDNSGLSYSISNKLIGGLPATINNVIQNILTSVKDCRYTPASYTIYYDPVYDLGDMLTIQADGIAVKRQIQTLITSYDFTFQGSSKIEGVGESIFLSKRNGNKDKADSAASSAEAYAKNNGTYIETYENSSVYEIADGERKRVVSIDYGNGKSDVIVLHGQCAINCTTAGTIALIYGKDGVDETFQPEKDLVVGKNIIDFYCFFLEPEPNFLSTYTVDIESTGAEIEIDTQCIRADVMATMFGNGKFSYDNYIDINVPVYRYRLNNYLVEGNINVN
jgi:hypothetical protein